MMMRALAGFAALVVMSGCAGVESAGRNSRAPAPGQVSEPAPEPPPPAQTPPPETGAPGVASGARVTPEPPPAPAPEDDEVVVRGQIERQIPPPEGDPRSTAERMRDVHAWDQCVSQAQAAGEIDPMRPALETPEELCARSLGMADRFAVPISRREQR